MPKYTPKAEETQRDDNNFMHHEPKDDQASRYAANREACNDLATTLRGNSPPSRELSLALTHLEEVCFWANASIARNE